MEKDNFSCCACCCSCCVISVYNVVLSIISLIMSLIVYVCIVSLIVWIMFRSNAVKFRIDDTKLTRFDLDIGNNNLHYNLSLSFSIRNSNRLIGIHYDRFQAMVYYSDKRLASVFVPPFYQGHKNTTVVETLDHHNFNRPLYANLEYIWERTKGFLTCEVLRNYL